MEKVSKITCSENLKESIRAAVNEIGGFEQYINSKDIVLLKPNFNTADPPPASTDIEFLKAAVQLIGERNPQKIIIGESSTMFASTQQVMEEKKVFDLEKMPEKPEVINFEKGKWINKKIRLGKFLKDMKVPEILDEATKLILLPCLKTHSWAQYTGALKLTVGFMKPFQRRLLHMAHLQEKIAEMNTIISPDLIVMDARKCFITKGPSHGDIRKPNIIMASRSRISIDEEGIRIIQSYDGNSLADFKIEDLPQIALARKLGIS